MPSVLNSHVTRTEIASDAFETVAFYSVSTNTTHGTSATLIEKYAEHVLHVKPRFAVIDLTMYEIRVKCHVCANISRCHQGRIEVINPNRLIQNNGVQRSIFTNRKNCPHMRLMISCSVWALYACLSCMLSVLRTKNSNSEIL